MNSLPARRWFLSLVGTAVVLAPTVHAAQPVSIANAGFENPVLLEATYPTTIPSWSQGRYDTTTPGVWVAGASISGHYNVSTNDYAGGTAPEGENTAYTTAAAGFDSGINQVLATTLRAEAEYVLSVKVGNPFGFNHSLTANWRVELLAGGVLLQSATGPSPVDDTSFTTATLTYNSGVAPAQLGQALEIRLLALDFPSTKQVDFDDVRLTVALANPVAVPGGPYFVALSGGSLALDGSASLPADGATITAYEWDLNGDGNFNEAITGTNPALISSADLQSVHGMTTTGANTIRLRVTDSAAKTSTAATTVTLVDAPLDLYRAGGGAWDTSTVNWGTVSGGPYDTAPWSNAAPLIANLQGGGGTLNLASNISLFGLNITAGTPRTITDHSLNFASGGIVQNNGANSGLNLTIRSGISGSPTGTVNAGEILTLDAQTGLPQTLGAIALNPRVGGTGDNRLTLQGDATGNSTGALTLTTTDNGQRTVVEKRGAGTWTVAALRGAYNQRLRMFLYDNGRLIVNGDIYGVELSFSSGGATLELKQSGNLFTVPSPPPGSGRVPNNVTSLRGTIDNSSGNLITFASNPAVTFAGDFTLAGSSLSFGSGTKNLGTVVRTVTVQEAASTMTLGGTVNGAAGGLIKTGDGTLALTGATRAYTGDTTVAAGTLSLSNGTFASALTVNDGVTLGLDVGATVISSAALTLADGAKVRLTGTPTAESYTLFQATAINGSPVLAAAFPNYQLVVADGGTTLKLNSTGAAPYLSWTGGPFAGTLTNTNPALDFDGGGLKTGIEWVVGGDPTAPGDDDALAPTFDNTSDPAFFIFKYRRTDAAAADAKTTIAAQYGSDLIGWTTAVAGADIVITPADDGAGAGIDLVVVKIRRTLAVGGRLFARLKVEVAMP